MSPADRPTTEPRTDWDDPALYDDIEGMTTQCSFIVHWYACRLDSGHPGKHSPGKLAEAAQEAAPRAEARDWRADTRRHDLLVVAANLMERWRDMPSDLFENEQAANVRLRRDRDKWLANYHDHAAEAAQGAAPVPHNEEQDDSRNERCSVEGCDELPEDHYHPEGAAPRAEGLDEAAWRDAIARRGDPEAAPRCSGTVCIENDCPRHSMVGELYCGGHGGPAEFPEDEECDGTRERCPAVGPAPRAGGLDVERLARAIDQHIRDSCFMDQACHGVCAEDIAATYLASRPSDERVPEPSWTSNPDLFSDIEPDHFATCVDCEHLWSAHGDAGCQREGCRCTEPSRPSDERVPESEEPR